MRKHYAFLAFCFFPLLIIATNPPTGGGKNKPAIQAGPDKDHPKPIVMLEGDIVLRPGFEMAYLKTANGCGISNFVMTCAGDSAQNQAPQIWAIADYSGGSYLSNTIPSKSVLGVAFRRESFPANTSVIQTYDSQARYLVITERGFFKYAIPNDYFLQNPFRIELMDSMLIPGVLMAAQQITTVENNPIVLCVADSISGYRLRFFAYPTLSELHNSTLPFMPELMEVTTSGLFVAGTDTAGQQRLLHYSGTQDSLLGSFLLNDSASIPREFLSFGGKHYLLSTPGDSMAILTSVDSVTGLFTQASVYSESGIRATYNEAQGLPMFTFQPMNDSLGNLEQQIIILNPVDLTTNTVMVNLELDYFKQPETVPQGFGQFDFEYVGGKWTGTGTDTVFIPRWSSVMPLPTGAKPSFVDASFGCWGNVDDENEDNISFSHYPNPISSFVTIHLTGLTKGNIYRVELMDIEGRSIRDYQVEAYQKIELPLSGLPAGTYFLSLDTGSRRLMKKVVLRP